MTFVWCMMVHELFQVWQLCGWFLLPGRMGFYCNCCIICGRGSAHPLLGDLGASQLQNWHQVWGTRFSRCFHLARRCVPKMLVEQSWKLLGFNMIQYVPTYHDLLPNPLSHTHPRSRRDWVCEIHGRFKNNINILIQFMNLWTRHLNVSSRRISWGCL